MLSEIIFGVFFSLLALYVYLTWNFDYWRRRGVAGPVPRAYLGTFPKTALMDQKSNYLIEMNEIYRKYYKKHRFIGVFEYRTPKLLILDPTLVTEIYVKYFKNFGDNTMSDDVDAKSDPLFKSNPFIERLAQWKERRSNLAPAFATMKMKAAYPVTENACRQLINFLNERTASGSATIPSREIATRVIADAVCSTMYGLDAKAFDEHSEFVEQSLKMFNSASPYMNIISFLFPILKKIFPNRFLSEGFSEWFHELHHQAIDLRTKNKISRDDYLNFLLDLQKRKNQSNLLTEAHAFTFFLDGFETTSYMLGNAINQLAKNTDCQQKLRDEVNKFDYISFDDLHQIPYLDAFLNEVLRSTPFPFPIWKTCTEDVELSDFDGRTVKIEKGTKIILPTTPLHNHPDYYENPDKFDPDRYDDGLDGVKRLKDAGVFMPFGNGPRICLGMRFAVTQIKAVLFSLVKHYQFAIKNDSNKLSAATGMFFFSENHGQVEIKRLK